jgi:hypothetical protein
VEIASHHTEGEGIAPRVEMKEGLLLHWIALETSDIAVRDTQFASTVEAHLADAAATLGDEASVAAGKASAPIAFLSADSADSRMPI